MRGTPRRAASDGSCRARARRLPKSNPIRPKFASASSTSRRSRRGPRATSLIRFNADLTPPPTRQTGSSRRLEHCPSASVARSSGSQLGPAVKETTDARDHASACASRRTSLAKSGPHASTDRDGQCLPRLGGNRRTWHGATRVLRRDNRLEREGCSPSAAKDATTAGLSCDGYGQCGNVRCGQFARRPLSTLSDAIEGGAGNLTGGRRRGRRRRCSCRACSAGPRRREGRAQQLSRSNSERQAED